MPKNINAINKLALSSHFNVFIVSPLRKSVHKV